MKRAPFYAEFLPRMGLRYFADALLTASETEFSAIVVHRSPEQGHIGKPGLAMLDRLVPHVRGAFDVAARLKGTESRTNAFERALDWLTDGAALLRKDGRVLYSNAAFDVIVRNNDGVRIAKGAIEFAAPQARARFAAALTTTCRVGGGDPDALRHSDFLAPRARDAPAYIVSLRPLLDEKEGRQRHDSVAIVFVRDPLGRNAAAARMLRELFGFTEAEANLPRRCKPAFRLTIMRGTIR